MSEAESRPSYTVSAAAQLAGMHPQTLRQYDALGLVVPARTKGGGRRYSTADVHRLRRIQSLTHDEGVNLAGVAKVLELTAQIDALRSEVEGLHARARKSLHPTRRVFAADRQGSVRPRPPAPEGAWNTRARREAEPAGAALARRGSAGGRSTLVVGSALYGWQRLAELHLARLHKAWAGTGSKERVE